MLRIVRRMSGICRTRIKHRRDVIKEWNRKCQGELSRHTGRENRVKKGIGIIYINNVKLFNGV